MMLALDYNSPATKLWCTYNAPPCWHKRKESAPVGGREEAGIRIRKEKIGKLNGVNSQEPVSSR
jgi:hypothetical protein